jgi:sarcosine oxidase subunit beta
MIRTADVVVVGAGVVGASIAYHLAARGARVLVVDRGPGPGAGSTSKATGGFRAQFGSVINVRLSLLARAKLERFADEIGADPGYQRVGYLFLAGSEAELASLAAARATQRSVGYEETVEVSPDEIARLQRGIRHEGILGGSFGPRDGFIRPMAILEGYLAAARRLGVTFVWDAAVIGMVRDGDRITAVETPVATLASAWVVNAAGPWASEVGALAGVAVPVEAGLRHVLPAAGIGALDANGPMTIFLDDGFHFRVRDGRALLLRAGSLDEIEAAARARVPALDGVPVDRAAAWSGLYEDSPDGHAIVGAIGNLVLANGSSGHGVMHSPALGQLVAELILDGRTTLDIHALRPSRFAEGDATSGVGLL